MIIIKEKAIITKQQHTIIIDVGENIPEGEYQVEITLKSFD